MARSVGVGVGPNFARARLVLAQRAGYLPQNYRINSGPQAVEQWKAISKNLADQARTAGYTNSLQWLRQGAASGQLPGKQETAPVPPDRILNLLRAL
jgi:hypothetical protein